MYPRASRGRHAPYPPPPAPRSSDYTHPAVANDNRVDMLPPYQWQPVPGISPRRHRFMPTQTLGDKRRHETRAMKRQHLDSYPHLQMGSSEFSGHDYAVAGSSRFPQPYCSPQPDLELPVDPPVMENLQEYAKDKLSLQVMDMFVACHQQTSDLLRKEAMRTQLLRDIKMRYPDARLYLTGSSMNGLSCRTSDADLCLVLEENRKRDALHVLTVLYRMFSSLLYVQKVLLIRAKVPILKFKERGSDLEFDLNVNNTVGIRNTFLLKSYANADPRTRPITLVVKKWAQHHQINDASKGTLSSYTLVLMVLHFLQTRQSPVVPCLQKDYPECFNPNMDIGTVPDGASNVPRYLSGNRSSLGELFLGFLKYYATDFRWDKQVISVREARALNKSHSKEWRNKYICVEEPFDRNNVARAVHDAARFNSIKAQFLESWRILQRVKDLNSILPVREIVNKENCKR